MGSFFFLDMHIGLKNTRNHYQRVYIIFRSSSNMCILTVKRTLHSKLKLLYISGHVYYMHCLGEFKFHATKLSSCRKPKSKIDVSNDKFRFEFPNDLDAL